MKINASGLGGGGVTLGRKAVIVKQIKQLQMRKKELLKELAAKAGGQSAESADLKQSTLVINKQATSAAGQATGEQPAQTAAADSYSIGQLMRNFQTDIASGANAVSMPDDRDAEEIAKELMMIEAQIMMLQQQIDEKVKPPEDKDENQNKVGVDSTRVVEESAVAATTPEAPATPTPPPAPETTNGHVDGYA